MMAPILLLLLACAAASAQTGPDAWKTLKPHFTPPATAVSNHETYRSVLQFADGAPVRTAGDWTKRRREILRDWHALMGPWPKALSRPKVTYLAEERTVDFTRFKLEIEIAPGRTTSAYLLTPKGKGPFPAILDVFYSPEDGAGLTPDKRNQHDFGYQMAKRGFAALCVGLQPWLDGPIYYPSFDKAQLQPLSYLAYAASNCHTILSRLPNVDPKRIGIVGHSYGGKWAMFAAALYDRFACAAVSDPGTVFDESRSNVNYWEPWYLGHEPGRPPRKPGIPTDENPRTGAYKRMVDGGHDLHEIAALIAPRPFFVAGGSEDPPERWKSLNQLVAVNRLLGYSNRAGLSNRPDHKISTQANDQICAFFEYFLMSRK